MSTPLLSEEHVAINVDDNQTYGHLLVVGGGPVGLSMAAALLGKFKKVTIVEKFDRPTYIKLAGDVTKSHPIILAPWIPGWWEKTGMWDKMLAAGTHSDQTCVHPFPGKQIRTEVDKTALCRSTIVGMLWEQLDALDGVEIHFGTTVRAVNFDKRTATLTNDVEVDYDMMIGADGVHSTTRQFIADRKMKKSLVLPSERKSFFTKEKGSKYIVWTPPPLSSMKGKCPGHGGHVFSNWGYGFFDKNDNRISKVTCAVPLGMTVEEALWPKIKMTFVTHFGCDEAETKKCLLDHESLRFNIVECDSFVEASDRVCLVGDASTAFLTTGDLMNMGMAVAAGLAEMIVDPERANQPLEEILTEWDGSFANAMRTYAASDYKKSINKMTGYSGLELVSFLIGGKTGMTGQHPLEAVHKDPNFDMTKCIAGYQADKNKLGYGSALCCTAFCGLIGGAVALAILL